jgi:hypothetical protein
MFLIFLLIYFQPLEAYLDRFSTKPVSYNFVVGKRLGRGSELLKFISIRISPHYPNKGNVLLLSDFINVPHPLSINAYLLAGVQKAFLFTSPLFRGVYGLDMSFFNFFFLWFCLRFLVMMGHKFNSLISLYLLKIVFLS